MMAREDNKPKEAADAKKSSKGVKKKVLKTKPPAPKVEAKNIAQSKIDDVPARELEAPNPSLITKSHSEDLVIPEHASGSTSSETETVAAKSMVGLEQMEVPTFEVPKLAEDLSPGRDTNSQTIQPDSPAMKPGITGHEMPLILNWNGKRLPPADFDKVATYNFRNPGFLSQSDLRQLSISHEKFLLHLSARLSTLLRLECSMKLLKFESSIFNKFTESIKGTTHLTLFQVEPLLGVGLLEVSIPFGLAVADRLLGGKGQVEEVNRNFSEIELTLLEDTIGIIFDEWVQQWPNENLHPECIGHETSGRFLQISPPDALIIVLNIEVVMGESLDQMRMEIPYSMLEPMVKKMHVAQEGNVDSRVKKIQWRTPYQNINVPAIAEWRIKDITIQDALNIKLGDVINLPKDLINKTWLKLSNTAEFLGTVGIENGNAAVQITKKVTPE